jgi:hypothetical protein
MPKKTNPKKTGKSQSFSATRSATAAVVIIVVLLAAVLVLIRKGSISLSGFLETPIPATPTPNPEYIGVEGCRRLPGFFNEIGLGPSPLVGTSFSKYVGFVIFDRNGSKQYIQNPSWRQAGNLGGFINDSQGNFYLIPVPFVSLELNPPEKQTILYRIDSVTGEMSPVLNLPAALPPSNTNPFGLMGLGLDCETNSLYVTSVAGSSAARQIGRIFRVVLSSMTVVDQLDGVDAIGVGVFKGVGGKRLYYGAARDPLVFSIGLDEKGNFVGEPRQEFSIASIPGVGNQRVRRINFLNVQQMSIRSVEFNFSLRASSNVPSNLINLDYDPGSDSWVVREVAPFDAEQ